MNQANEPKHQTDFQKVWFYPDYQLLHFEWYNTNLLRDETYKQEMLWQLEQIMHYQPERILFDSRNFTYTIAPEIQDWTSREITTKRTANIKKTAIAVSKDLFSQLSIEQLIEEIPKEVVQDLRYFDNIEQALNWLKE
ncbi:MAG: STAS/SEC14 domain-containing protein [Microscillaceae bacterium]|nr:STAS/SEC14 domain-containing protein [Microscillaceae bacterium]MDW8459926.1 STAS/SEC14 domain-containing protein [Cytophagales bacterium]